jgi:hypothetical protein
MQRGGREQGATLGVGGASNRDGADMALQVRDGGGYIALVV